MPNGAALFRLVAGVGLALLSSRATGAEDKQACGLKPIAILDMRSDPGGTVRVPVKVNGTELYFMVDTGGIFSTIDPALATRMQLTLRKVSMTEVGIAHARSDTMTSPDDFSVGPGLHSSKFWLYLTPQKVSNLDGTLSPDFLRSFDVDFDFAGGKFNLIDPDHCAGKVVYWHPESLAIVPMTIDARTGHIKFPVTVDGKSITAELDTGATGSIISMKAVKDLLNVSDKDPAMTQAQKKINGETLKVFSYPFKALQFVNADAGTSIAVNNPEITILEDDALHNFEPNLVLGMSALRQLHLYIAYKERKLYLSPAAAPPATAAH